ncbi:MAG: hypothetical protein L3J23_02775 [Flavobacteriaceae bacterium]|nr:hypothetical protein [Flavobacteriaceae bacterium]
MKTIIPSLLFLILLTNCNEKSALQKEFNCESVTFSPLEKITDFKEKFSLKVPKKWATKLFYNNHETNIMSADSLKSFSKTYILEVSLISGDLKLDPNFTHKIITDLVNEEKLITLKHDFNTFKKLPSVWFLSSGESGKFKYHYFQLFIKKSPTNYFKITTKIYGDKLVENRLCESIALMHKIEF